MKRCIILLCSSLLAFFNVLEFAHAQSEIVASLDWRHAKIPESILSSIGSDRTRVLSCWHDGLAIVLSRCGENWFKHASVLTWGQAGPSLE